MNQLTIVEMNGQFLVDSREVAEMVGKEHKNLLRDIKGYCEILTRSDLSPSNFFIESDYVDGKGELRPHYLLTKKGCDMVANKMTGEKGILFTAAYVTKFEEMEKQLSTPANLEKFLLTPDTIIKLAENWKQEQQLRLAAESRIEADRPKVIFAEALETSKTSILIGELAKILKQNEISIGQNRLFDLLRNEGYLGKRGEYYNMPTQKSMEMNLFEIKTTTINNPDGSVRVTKTPKVTGKGQIYFINKFKKEQIA